MARDGAPRPIGTGAGLAAIRQGFKELATATKSFPDAIAVDEPGTMFSPTQGEIAEANRGSSLADRIQEGRDRAADRQPERGMDRE